MIKLFISDVDGVLTKLVTTKSTKTLNYNFTNEFAYICYPAAEKSVVVEP